LDRRSRSARVNKKIGSQRLAWMSVAKKYAPGLTAPRVTRYIPSTNCGIVTPQKNAAIILLFNVRAYILRVS